MELRPRGPPGRREEGKWEVVDGVRGGSGRWGRVLLSYRPSYRTFGLCVSFPLGPPTPSLSRSFSLDSPPSHVPESTGVSTGVQFGSVLDTDSYLAPLFAPLSKSFKFVVRVSVSRSFTVSTLDPGPNSPRFGTGIVGTTRRPRVYSVPHRRRGGSGTASPSECLRYIRCLRR